MSLLCSDELKQSLYDLFHMLKTYEGWSKRNDTLDIEWKWKEISQINFMHVYNNLSQAYSEKFSIIHGIVSLISAYKEHMVTAVAAGQWRHDVKMTISYQVSHLFKMLSLVFKTVSVCFLTVIQISILVLTKWPEGIVVCRFLLFQIDILRASGEKLSLTYMSAVHFKLRIVSVGPTFNTCTIFSP